MDFEEHCVRQMQRILSDLSANVEFVLRNVNSADNTEETQSGVELSEAASDFVESLSMFGKVMDARMRISPMEKLERDNYLRESIADLKETRREVEALESELEEERSRHEQAIRAISDEIEQEKSFIEEIKVRHAAEVSERIKQSETLITKIEEETSVAMKGLEIDIEEGRLKLRDVSRANLMRERGLYGKRAEVEKIYLEVLAKYDADVGELHRRMESLTEELHSLEEKLRVLGHELEVQDVQYVELKTERETAILKAFAEDLENFEKNRAARIIQRAWRCFYERYSLRKKKKSKKKKG